MIVFNAPHTFSVDYYGRPEFWKKLARWDIEFGQWSDKRVSRSQLGPSKSGKFCIYLLRFVPADLTHSEIVQNLTALPCIPPPDNFTLDYCDRYTWGKGPKVLLPLKIKQPLALPEKELEVTEDASANTIRQLTLEL